jgi:hypothetical protein
VLVVGLGGLRVVGWVVVLGFEIIARSSTRKAR